jgi:hypothetical protein
LLKRPSSKLGRLTLLSIAICGGLAAILALAILADESIDPARSAIWHMRHGSTVSFDGHLFHLPLSWYPEPVTTPGQLNLRHAQFGGMTIDSVDLAMRPRSLNDQAATDTIRAETANLNQHEPASSASWAAETLRGRKLTFHCTMSTTAGAAETLICQAADSNLIVFALTAGRSQRTDALNIIETSE